MFIAWKSAISWKANLQSIVALSSIEAEYIVAIEVVKEGLWLKGMINELERPRLVVIGSEIGSTGILSFVEISMTFNVRKFYKTSDCLFCDKK